MLKLTCQHCGYTADNIPHKYAGKIVKCPKCKQGGVRIPDIELELDDSALDVSDPAPVIVHVAEKPLPVRKNSVKPAELSNKEESEKVFDTKELQSSRNETPTKTGQTDINPPTILNETQSDNKIKVNKVKEWNIGGKIIFISACISTLSMFMNWVDIGLVSQSGLTQGTFIFLGFYIYPVLMLFKNKSISKTWGLVCSIVAIIFTLIYIDSKSIEFMGNKINASATGAWLFLLSSIALVVGVVKYRPKNKDEKEATETIHSIENSVNSCEENNNFRLINKKQNNGTVDLTQIITNFCNDYSDDKSENIWWLDQIKNEYIEKHIKAYLNITSDEKILLLLNKGAMLGNVFTGLVITNICIHFCTLKKSFFTGILPWFFKGERGKANISGLKSLEIAEHDTCFGNAYVGHELRINDEILGYVRMGTNIVMDDKAIAFLNALFNRFAEHGIIERKVNNYNWQ